MDFWEILLYFELLKLSNIKLQNKFGVHVINTLEEAEILATKLRIFFTKQIFTKIIIKRKHIPSRN